MSTGGSGNLLTLSSLLQGTVYKVPFSQLPAVTSIIMKGDALFLMEFMDAHAGDDRDQGSHGSALSPLSRSSSTPSPPAMLSHAVEVSGSTELPPPAEGAKDSGAPKSAAFSAPKDFGFSFNFASDAASLLGTSMAAGSMGQLLRPTPPSYSNAAVREDSPRGIAPSPVATDSVRSLQGQLQSLSVGHPRQQEVAAQPGPSHSPLVQPWASEDRSIPDLQRSAMQHLGMMSAFPSAGALPPGYEGVALAPHFTPGGGSAAHLMAAGHPSHAQRRPAPTAYAMHPSTGPHLHVEQLLAMGRQQAPMPPYYGAGAGPMATSRMAFLPPGMSMVRSGPSDNHSSDVDGADSDGEGAAWDPQKVVVKDILGGQDTRTTVMVRNIPSSYTRDMVFKEVSSHHPPVHALAPP